MGENIEIRPIRPDEIDEVLNNAVEAFNGVCIEQNLGNKFPEAADNIWQKRKASGSGKPIISGASGCMVVIVDRKFAGHLSFSTDVESKIAKIHDLAVRKKYRGRGLSRKLFDAVFAHLKEIGMKSCRIETLEQNQLCCRYYPKLGFEEIARQIYYCKML